MNLSELEKYQIELDNESPQKILKWAIDYFGVENITLASSLGAEDQVLTDMVMKINKDINVFTIDTGRHFQETYAVLTNTRKKYNKNIEILFPEKSAVQDMVSQYGPNLFYESVEKRKLCCNVRKVQSIEKKFTALKAWICGLRQTQSPSRVKVKKIEYDQRNKIVKLSPLSNWTEEDVWDYIKKNDVPHNNLHDKGYSSIGCAPCTRSVKHNESVRAGRWWWESAEDRDCECGIHKK